MNSRTSIVDALHIVLEILKSGEPFTLNKLARESGLNFRTVKKIIDILQSSNNSFFGRQLDVLDLQSSTVIQLKEKTGLLLFPEAIQNLIIKTNHYPVASRDEEVLVYLLLQKATGRENAVRLPESKIVKELVEAEHVGKIGERFYITKDGAYIAQGALELYPELRDISAQMPKGGGDAESARSPLITVAVPPNLAMIKRRLEAKRGGGAR